MGPDVTMEEPMTQEKTITEETPLQTHEHEEAPNTNTANVEDVTTQNKEEQPANKAVAAPTTE